MLRGLRAAAGAARTVAPARSPLWAPAFRLISTASPEFAANVERTNEIISVFREIKSQVSKGGSERAVAQHRQRGKLMVRERVEALIDPGSPFMELSMLAAYTSDGKNKFPSSGILTGIGLVHGRPCMIVANDPTVQGGTYMHITVKKHLRAQKIAMENQVPCVRIASRRHGVTTAAAHLPYLVAPVTTVRTVATAAVHLPRRIRGRQPDDGRGRRDLRGRERFRPDLLQPGASSS